jgi:carbonic anhydrase
MAKTPPPAAAAPVLDQVVEGGAEGDAAPRKKFSLKLPAFMSKLPKVHLSKKLVIIIGASVLTVSAAGAAALVLWPSAPAPEQKLAAGQKKPKKAKKAAGAASAASAAESGAMAASAAEEGRADTAHAHAEPASSPEGVVAQAHAPVASGPEESMDKLRRRLAETLASGGKLEGTGPGELRLTARQVDPHVVAAGRAQAHGERPPAGHAEPADPHAAPKAGKADEHAAMQHLHWSYDGPGGPESWGKLKPEFAKCSSGQRQSPIDIKDGIQVNLEPIRFDYKPTAFRVIDNGHTVQVNLAPGNAIEVNGKRFELLQFHFHRPSEERIDGKQFDMVAHLVHKDADGKLAVVAVLLERGSAHPLVQSVWNNLPLEQGEEQAASAPMDLNSLLPAERQYYTYMGSLTTPPCSEGVLWMVMKQPVNIAPEQISIFARMYPMNARPIQSASGRMIKESH